MSPNASASPMLLGPDQLARMSPADLQRYYATLPADQADAEQHKLQSYMQQISISRRQFLEKSFEKMTVCPPNGGGISATYAPGQTLVFNLPSAGGAYLKELEVWVDIKFTPATGTSATYGWTPAGAAAWFSQIVLNYGSTAQHTIIPYFLIKLYESLRNKQWLANQAVLSGLNADATTTGIIASPQPALTGGTPAVSKFRFRIPMQIQPKNPIGLLPIQGNGTLGTVTFTCPSTLGAANADPMLTPILYTGGSGNGITLDATEKTITVFAVYADGNNYEVKTPLTLNLDGLPTAQFITPTPLNNLTAGSVQRQRVDSLMQHHFFASVIIDGVQSTSFSTEGNIQIIELDQDAAGTNKFWQYGSANNTDFATYLMRIRRAYGQDFDPGVVIWTNAEQYGTVDVDNRDGSQILDMRSGHWSSVNYGVQVGSVSATNFTPRVVSQLFSVNEQGLVIAG